VGALSLPAARDEPTTRTLQKLGVGSTARARRGKKKTAEASTFHFTVADHTRITHTMLTRTFL
jgi:hypothetical protein